MKCHLTIAVLASACVGGRTPSYAGDAQLPDGSVDHVEAPKTVETSEPPAVGEPCDGGVRQGLCIRWPGGYVSQVCAPPPGRQAVTCGQWLLDIECPGSCGTDQLCTNGGAMTICLKRCTTDKDCRSSYRCKTYKSGGACVPDFIE